MHEKETFLEAVWDEAKPRLWVIPLGFSIALTYASVRTIVTYGVNPILLMLALLGLVGVWVSPMFPTRRDLLLHWTHFVKQVDARWQSGLLPQEEATRILMEGSSYAHHRNAVWWPLWWLSERKKLQRLTSELSR